MRPGRPASVQALAQDARNPLIGRPLRWNTRAQITPFCLRRLFRPSGPPGAIANLARVLERHQHWRADVGLLLLFHNSSLLASVRDLRMRCHVNRETANRLTVAVYATYAW
jgi:hypothetical protein